MATAWKMTRAMNEAPRETGIAGATRPSPGFVVHEGRQPDVPRRVA